MVGPASSLTITQRLQHYAARALASLPLRLQVRLSGKPTVRVDGDTLAAAVEDARAALGWAYANAGQLGADGRRVGVGGDSAGGNLATVVSRLAAGDGGPAPVLQLLIYPVTDFTLHRRSRELFREGFLLTNAEMDWFEANYLGRATSQASDPRVSPVLAPDLSGLAPALVL